MKTTEERIKALEAEITRNSQELQQLKQDIKPTFEVGKWYKTDCLNGSLFCITELPIELNEVKGYGFENGYWYHKTTCGYWTLEEKHNTRPATESEVFEALKKEAIKRGFKKGCKVKNNKTIKEGRIYNIESDTFNYTDNTLTINGIYIFWDGVWAEIIKDEPIKIGGYEVKKLENGSYDIGCKKQISNGKVRVLRRLMIQCNFTKVSFDGIETDLETINKILNL